MLGTIEDSTDVLLIAQSLPSNLGVIAANPTLEEDHTRGIMVAKHAVQYTRFDDEVALGPVPTMFSTDPEASLTNLTPQAAFKCLQALVSRLLARQELTRYQIFSNRREKLSIKQNSCKTALYP